VRRVGWKGGRGKRAHKSLIHLRAERAHGESQFEWKKGRLAGRRSGREWETNRCDKQREGSSEHVSEERKKAKEKERM